MIHTLLNILHYKIPKQFTIFVCEGAESNATYTVGVTSLADLLPEEVVNSKGGLVTSSTSGDNSSSSTRSLHVGSNVVEVFLYFRNSTWTFVVVTSATIHDRRGSSIIVIVLWFRISSKIWDAKFGKRQIPLRIQLITCELFQMLQTLGTSFLAIISERVFCLVWRRTVATQDTCKVAREACVSEFNALRSLRF